MYAQVSRTNITANCIDNTTSTSYEKLPMKSRFKTQIDRAQINM